MTFRLQRHHNDTEGYTQLLLIDGDRYVGLDVYDETVENAASERLVWADACQVLANSWPKWHGREVLYLGEERFEYADDGA